MRIDLDKDLSGWRPVVGQQDKYGQEIADRIYNQKDFDRTLVLERRTQLVAKKITQFLKETNRFDKTIVFCEDIDHAERMRQALVNENSDLVAQNSKYIMRITGDNAEGKAELDNFILPESRYPVIVTTSKLMTTGIDFNNFNDRHLFGDIYEQILRDLQSAGNAGEYYTPRAVTQFMVDMVDPKLGETILDPACGTGGFLTCTLEHIRNNYVQTAADRDRL